MFIEETRDTDDEADADILISAIRHDLGDAEKSDEGEGERIEGENEPKKTDESAPETVAGGGDTSSQPCTNIPNHNLHPPTLDTVQIPVKTSTQNDPNCHPQCTQNFVDYQKLNNPAT